VSTRSYPNPTTTTRLLGPAQRRRKVSSGRSHRAGQKVKRLETFVLFRVLVTKMILVSILVPSGGSLVLPEVSGVRLPQVVLSEELTYKFDNTAIKDMKYHEEEPSTAGRSLVFFVFFSACASSAGRDALHIKLSTPVIIVLSDELNRQGEQSPLARPYRRRNTVTRSF